MLFDNLILRISSINVADSIMTTTMSFLNVNVLRHRRHLRRTRKHFVVQKMMNSMGLSIPSMRRCPARMKKICMWRLQVLC